jgi:hypothetical protein
MTKQDKTFVQDWVSADVWALDGKYYRKDPEYLPNVLKTWTKMFERVPVTQKAMYVFRMEGDAKCQESHRCQDRRRRGDRYASFAHSPHMVREYALLQSTPDIHMCIMCVKIPKGTKYAF